MLFALNYSPQAAALLAAGAIEIDLYKAADWPDMIADARAQRPVYVHFPLLAGRGLPDAARFVEIETMWAETDTPHLNTHLAPHAGDMGMALDTTSPADSARLLDAMLRDIWPLVARYGSQYLVLENAIWDPDYAIPRPVLEPTAICRAVYETGCGFLLDTAHAVASARYLGMDERAYINALPVDRLRELHVTGVRYQNGRWHDHYALTCDDWSLTSWVFDNIRAGEWPTPWGVAFEYGGSGPHFSYRSDPAVIAEQVPRLYDLAHSLPEAAL